jgi:hypothetical protein
MKKLQQTIVSIMIFTGLLFSQNKNYPDDWCDIVLEYDEFMALTAVLIIDGIVHNQKKDRATLSLRVALIM